jgi:hypothetical protein
MLKTSCDLEQWFYLLKDFMRASHDDKLIHLDMCLQIMLKDMTDSKRVNANIHQMPPTVRSPVRGRARRADLTPLDALVLSALFWPTPPAEDEIKLPEPVRV